MLRAKADRQASTLSGGEQKMLEIGRAMLLQPRLLLIDEPSVGLSPILVRQVFGLMRQLCDRGTTVLMIEQNAKSALAVSDYGIVLQQGRVALAGTAAEVLDHPEIGPLFLGGPSAASAKSPLWSVGDHLGDLKQLSAAGRWRERRRGRSPGRPR